MRAILLLLALLCQGAGAQIPNAAQGFRLPLTAFAKGTWGPQAPVASFAGQIAQESMFNCAAVSRTGARGCAQVMPATGDWLSKLFPSQLERGGVGNPMWDIRALVLYDHWLYKRIKADNECERFAFALSAYNGGELWVKRRKAISSQPGICFGATCDINPGIHEGNQRENASYPRRILKMWGPRFEASGWGRNAC